MNKEAHEAEKAEFIQSVKALMIPLSLFLSCVVMAAGTFLIYNGEPLGWIFAAVATATVIAAFVALIRFQNKFRARGVIRSNMEDDLLVFDPESIGVGTPTPKAPATTAPGVAGRPTATISK
jgi:membrane protein YdbS with pleckstrin-like domain